MVSPVTGPLIGVFDSGVGGLSILASLRAQLPAANYAYLFDNAHFPYGPRAEDEVRDLTVAACARLARAQPIEALVIACGTASTASLPPLRQALTLPVIGVVPAVKPAAALSRSKTIALLATHGTVTRPYTDDLIATHAAGCRVLRAGSLVLVEQAERKLRGEAVDLAAVRGEIAPLFAASPAGDQRLDVVVLGCTHFPLLVDELTAVAPWPVAWIDCGTAIAARAATVLGERANILDAAPKLTAWVTQLNDSAHRVWPALQRLGFADLKELP